MYALQPAPPLLHAVSDQPRAPDDLVRLVPPTASTYFVATGRGIVVLGASADTLSVQLASEISGTTMTVNTNACLRIRRIA